MLTWLRVCALPLLALIAAGADDQWTQFRGPNGSGVDSAAGYPVEFSPSKNVVWKTAIPYGQSSPIVAGGHIYLTAAEPAALLTICLDAKSGGELWRREIVRKKPQTIFRANDPASPTPAADNDGVAVFFAEFGLVAYTADGKDRWSAPLGPFKNFYGMAASPIIADGMVVQVIDQQSGSFLLALDRKTGEQRWKTPRTQDIGWATPMVFRPADGPAQLIVLGSARLDSYYLATGEPIWWMPISTMGALGTPVAMGNSLLVSTLSSNDPLMPVFASVVTMYDKDHDGRLSHDEFKDDKDLGEHFGWIDDNSDGFITETEWNKARNLQGTAEYGAIALDPGKSRGELKASAVRWRFKKNLPYIPAPVAYKNVYYMVRDGGIITSLDPATGKLLKEGRTRDAIGEYYASPVAADNKLYLANADGKVTVLKAGGDWQVLAVNDLADEIHATPALSESRIFVRTRSFIYCFGASKP